MPTASIDGKNCFYQDIGEGYPVLLGHSYLWDSSMWEPQLKILSANGFRCIAPDLWDHGKSDHLTGKKVTIEQLADDAWKLMQYLEIPEFPVIGLSVGGMWGAELAFKHPNAVKALVLMDTFIGSEPIITKLKYFALLDIIEREKRFVAPLLNQVIPLFFSRQTLSKKTELVDSFREALEGVKKENIPGIVALGRAIFSRNCSLNRLSKLMLPALIIVGKEDIPRPPRESQEMASRISNAEIQIIEDAGHISNLEQPEQVNTYLMDFLSKNICKRTTTPVSR